MTGDPGQPFKHQVTLVYFTLVTNYVLLGAHNYLWNINATMLYISILVYVQYINYEVSVKQILMQNIPQGIGTMIALILIEAVQGKYSRMKVKEEKLMQGHSQFVDDLKEGLIIHTNEA